MKTFIIQAIFILSCTSSIAQSLNITIYNKTGFDVDSASIGDKYIGLIKKDSSIIILDCKELTIQDEMPYRQAAGVIKNKIRDKNLLPLCGTGAYNVTTGQYEFDLTFIERDSGYRLFMHSHRQ